MAVASAVKGMLGHPKAAFILMTVATGLRLALILAMGQAPLEGDAAWYAQAGSEWANGAGYDPYWPPGVPGYLALFDRPFGISAAYARLAMIPFFMLLFAQIRRALLPIAGNAFTNGILLLFAIYPAFLLHSTEPLSQVPAAYFLLLAWNECTAFRKTQRFSRLWIMGLALGLLLLFRPAALVLVLWPIGMAFSGLRHRKKPQFQWLIPTIPLLAILITASTLISLSQDRPILLNDANARNFYLGNNAWTPDYKTWYYGSHWAYDPAHPVGFRKQLETIEALPKGEQSKAFFQASVSEIRHRPGTFLLRSLNRFRVFFAFDTMAASRLQHKGKSLFAAFTMGLDALAFLSLLLLAAAFAVFPSPDRKLLLGIVLLYAFPYCFSFSHPTFHLPITPLLAVMAAAAWEPLQDFHTWPRRRKIQLASLVFLLLLLQFEWVYHMGSAWLA